VVDHLISANSGIMIQFLDLPEEILPDHIIRFISIVSKALCASLLDLRVNIQHIYCHPAKGVQRKQKQGQSTGLVHDLLVLRKREMNQYNIFADFAYRVSRVSSAMRMPT